MKKLLISALFLVSGAAFADPPGYYNHHHGHWRHGGGNSWHWVAPTIIGGVIGYEIARHQQPMVVQSQTFPPPVVMQQNCSPWTEIRNPDGTVTYTRTCTQ